MSGCRNCPNDCCCECKNPDCKLCIKKPNIQPYYDIITQKMDHKDIGERRCVMRSCNSICFNCRALVAGYTTSDDKCMKCANPVYAVTSVVRIPKLSDIKSWKLLELLVTCIDLKNAQKNTLAYYYINNGNICCKTHAEPSLRSRIYIPINFREYKEWVSYMLNTIK